MDYSSDEDVASDDGSLDLSDREDEIMPSDDSENEEDYEEGEEDDDDDDDDDDDGMGLDGGKFDRFKIETQKDEMASDIEDDNEEDYLTDSQAWGKNKRQFYDTDFVDKDFRSIKEKDRELAKFEEQEALAVQKRLLQSVDEADLGLDLLIGPPKEAATTKEAPPKFESLSKEENIGLDISLMSDKEKLAIIKQDSPELELLIADFQKYSKEVVEQLNQTIDKLTQLQAPSSGGLEFLKLRRTLLLNYCTNISFYLSLKTSNQKEIIKNHPVIKQLVIYKKFIAESDGLMQGSKLMSEVEYILSHDDVRFVQPTKPAKKKAKPVKAKVAEKLPTVADVVADEEEQMDEEEEEEGKRAITYQMEKNKGLLPKRKREQRNPRVKYRRKFEKAVIRRKGQVREPRKELKKYGGELTGINVRAVKSVKFR